MKDTIRGRISRIILVSLLIITLTSVVTLLYNTAVINDINDEALYQVLSTKQTSIERYLEGIKALAMNIAYNKSIQDLLIQSNTRHVYQSDAQSLAVSTMMNAAASQKSVLNIQLSNVHLKHVAEAGSSSSGTIDYRCLEYSENAYFSEITRGALLQAFTPLFYFYLPVYSNSEKDFRERIGSLVIIMNTLELRELLTVEKDRETQFMLVDSKNQIITSVSNISADNESKADPALNSNHVFSVADYPDRYTIIDMKVKGSPWRILAINNNGQINHNYRRMIIVFAISFLACVSVIIIIYTSFTNSILHNVRQIVNLIMSTPGSEFPENTTTLREFTHIEDTYRMIIERSEALEREKEQRIRDAYELKLTASRWEIDAIRRQLQPHFIYNTLEHLRGMALYHHQTELSNQIMMLAKILRYDFQGGMFAYISQEMEMIGYYRDIVLKRAGTRFSIDIDCDPELMDKCMPRMLLQPLVENAVQHGMQQVLTGGWIRVKIQSISEWKMMIVVEDNGAGMTQEKQDELENLIRNTQDSAIMNSVGLVSSIRRIQLMYRDQADWEVHSEPAKGTTIRITIPKEGTGYNAGIDS